MTRAIFFKALSIAILFSLACGYISGWQGREQTTDRLYTRHDLEHALMDIAESRDDYCDLRVLNILYQMDRQGYQFEVMDEGVTIIPIKTKERR